MIRKLELIHNFTINLSCVRKPALCARLIEPSTAIDILALKSCVGNEQNEGSLRVMR